MEKPEFDLGKEQLILYLKKHHFSKDHIANILLLSHVMSKGILTDYEQINKTGIAAFQADLNASYETVYK